jgi:hypothetical protein
VWCRWRNLEKTVEDSNKQNGISRPHTMVEGLSEREMCPWAISKYFGD